MWTVMSSPIGDLRIIERDGAISAIEFTPFRQPPDGRPLGARGDDHPLLAEAVRQLTAYFARDLKEFDLPPDPLPDNVGSTNPPTPDFLPREQCYKGCVQDGPFANLTLHLGPGRLYTERCLVRGFDPSRRKQLSGPVIEGLMERQTFEEFRQGIDISATGIHSAGHAMVGGEVSNLYSAGGGAFKSCPPPHS